ncbi:hypothetical protein RA272_28360, partial [Pseudomonas syringae pv. tagetis]|uniref:hypothetical protein n=1 Tax=Pseudomonas syringae group genomosp. 7 TaxID=251699 RepID=UPI00377056CB
MVGGVVGWGGCGCGGWWWLFWCCGGFLLWLVVFEFVWESGLFERFFSSDFILVYLHESEECGLMVAMYG